MDGVALLVKLLMEDQDMTATVPATRIMGGDLPQGTRLSAIAIKSVSRVDHHPLRMGTRTLVRQRVQITALAATYEAQQEALRAARKAVTAIQRPQFWAETPDWFNYLFAPYISDISVLTDTAGPDFMIEEAMIYAGSQDYRVVFNEER